MAAADLPTSPAPSQQYGSLARLAYAAASPEADAGPSGAELAFLPSSDVLVAQPAEVAPALDAEKLVVYHLALELQVLCAGLVPAHHRVVQDQLERASLSVVLNIAEGAGRHSRKEKRRFYSIARGSAAEAAAVIDVLRLRRLAPEAHCAKARSLAVRVVQMLTKLTAALA